MKRRLLLAFVLLVALPLPIAKAHLLDHPVQTFSGTAPPLSTEFNSGGENAEWELIATLPTLNPHSDLDFFQQKGETYASVGNLGTGANGGGQVIFKLTEEGDVTSSSPELISNIPTAACISNPEAALGLQHDVEATPKASTIANTEVTDQNTTDTNLLIDATDAEGRCHDQGLAGIRSAPMGGLEIIDVTDIANPREIGLTSHIGEAHTVNVDPRRPHIAYVVTSDTISVNAMGVRENDSGQGRELDGFEVVDLRSCLEAPLGTIPPGSTIDQKREACRPQVFRYRYPSIDIVQGHTNKGTINACHELELYPDDRLTCGSGSAAILFDIKKIFNDAGTPADFTDDTLNGDALPCSVRDSSTQIPLFQTGAKVTDCVVGEKDGQPQELGIPAWREIGSPSLSGVEHVGSAFHMGREATNTAVTPDYDATEDIDFDHELEFSDSRKILLATDERGGGVGGGAQCSPGADIPFANGGIHAYVVNRLQKSTPTGETAPERAEEAFKAYALNSEGEKAIFRTPIQTQPQGSFCTAHVFQQIPGENRIFMGWYSQGTQVIDFTETNKGVIDFKRAGFFIPENANQWVSSIFKVVRNPDGTSTYFGATGDGIVGDAGRNGVDVFKVTLPAAPLPPNRVAPPGTVGPNPNAPNTPGLPTTPTPDPSCAVASGFNSAAVTPRGRGLRFDFSRAVDRPARADVFQSSLGNRLVRRRVARFDDKTKSFTFKGRKGLRNGTYVARIRLNVPGRGADVRRFSLSRKNGRFTLLDDFAKPLSCGLVRKSELSGNAFGGRKNKALGVAFRLEQAAQVSFTVRRGNKVVRRVKAKTFQPGRNERVSIKSKGLKKGLYTVTLDAVRSQTQATVTLAARKV